MALVFAEKFNEVHRKGYDANGNTGKDFFAVGSGSVVSNTHNKGKADFDIKYNDVSKVTGNNYDVSYDGTNWNVTRLPEGIAVTANFDGATGTLSFEGMDIKISNNTAQAGDKFLLAGG